MEKSTARTNKRKLIWGIVLIVGPTALILLSIIIYAVMNFVLGAVDTGDAASMSAEGGAFKTAVNVILYLVGAISVLAWLPGLVIGIILIATRK